eukprot:s1174_g3.t1
MGSWEPWHSRMPWIPWRSADDDWGPAMACCYSDPERGNVKLAELPLCGGLSMLGFGDLGRCSITTCRTKCPLFSCGDNVSGDTLV